MTSGRLRSSGGRRIVSLDRHAERGTPMSRKTEVPTTALAHTLTPEAAFAKALDNDSGYERAEDVTVVMMAALSYAKETMSGAIGELAFRARGGEVVSASGHRLRALPGPSPRAVDLLLTQDGRPGGRLITVHYAPVAHAEGAAALAALHAEREAEMDALGLSGHARLLAGIGLGEHKLATTAEIERYQTSGAPYRRARPGDAVSKVQSTSLDMGDGVIVAGASGLPRELERGDAAQAKDALPVKAHPSTWWPGIDFEVRPAFRGPGAVLRPASGRAGAGFHATFSALSELIRDAGLARLVEEQNRVIAHTPWLTSGVSRFPDLEEAGYAAVHGSGGFFDAAAAAHVRRFSEEIAAQDVANFVDEWVSTARGLADQGFVSEDTAFEANDGRDVVFAEARDDRVTLRSSTQHGEYETVIDLGPGDAVLGVVARRDGGEEFGRFVMTEGGLRPEYASIEHRIRNVRDMNGVVMSLTSVACVFEEEHGQREGPSGP